MFVFSSDSTVIKLDLSSRSFHSNNDNSIIQTVGLSEA